MVAVKSRAKRIKILGYATLTVGIVLLVVTFYNVYLLLMGVLKIPTSGNPLVPLIEAVIRVIYLFVMGWIGAVLTRRGVQVITSPVGATDIDLKKIGKAEISTPEKKTPYLP